MYQVVSSNSRSFLCLPTLSAELFIYVFIYRFAEFLTSTCIRIISPFFQATGPGVLEKK